MSADRCPESPEKQAAVLRLVLSAGAGLCLFVWVAILATHSQIAQFDLLIRDWVHRSTPSLTAFFIVVSQIGSWFVLLPLGVLISIIISDRSSEVRLLNITLYGSVALSAALKLIFQVSRPEPYFGLATPDTHAFPSAHALVSFCFFSLLAGIICRRVPSQRFHLFVWGLAVFLTMLIGISRIYLGVQLPTSVLAGYAAAIAWMELVKFAVARFASDDGS
jgi:undecaprenyl-diphosphatase